MIGIVLSEKDFELEIQTLVRAFFPEEESRLWTLPEEKMWNRLFDGDSAKTDPEELKSRRGEQNEADEVIAWENGQRESGKVAAWENGQRESGEVAAWENGQRESGKVAAWENGEHGSGEMAVELFQQSLPEEFPSCELYLGIRLQSGRILMLAAMGQQVFYRCFLPEQTDED